jgi:hypothetical protein
MNVVNGTETAQFLFWECLFRIFGVVSLHWSANTATTTYTNTSNTSTATTHHIHITNATAALKIKGR